MADDEPTRTPDDPDFEGAEFISREAMIQYKVANFELDGIAWTGPPGHQLGTTTTTITV
jgi:hypothetical protein